MKVSGACYGCKEEDDSNSTIHGQAYDFEQHRLADGAEKGEAIAYEVELGDLQHI